MNGIIPEILQKVKRRNNFYIRQLEQSSIYCDDDNTDLKRIECSIAIK